MIKKITLAVISMILIFSVSCKKTYENADAGVVINELMPVNSSTVADQNGQFDDWIELYNYTSSTIDLSGYFLSDDKKDITKWQFPHGTLIGPKGYLIIWADNDTLQAGLHADFKLSSAGEDVLISDAAGKLIDKVSFPAQNLELSYSRIPDGTGEFQWHSPTFNRSNGTE
jgi:hypothetical protein